MFKIILSDGNNVKECAFLSFLKTILETRIAE